MFTEAPEGSPFRIRDLILFDVGLVRIFDPDVGKFVRIKALTFARSRTGPGSIAVAAGQVVLVRVSYQSGPLAGAMEGRRLALGGSGHA